MVAALDQETAGRILDLLSDPPAAGKYAALKARLLETFDLSEYERAAKILHMPELGDDKPSVLMDKMLALLGTHPPCFLFRHAFLERIREDIRATLIHAKMENCRELAKAADKLWEAKKPIASSVNRIERYQDSKEKKIGSSPSDRPTDVCFFHHRFGDKANRCSRPCKFFSSAGNSPAGRQ